jgi:hypothetical protein
MFWVVQQNRRYARIIMQHDAALAPALTRLMAQNNELEDAVGPIRLVVCHNNHSRAAFLDDGQRIWLVDRSHGGWNDDLYYLAGLAIHLELDRVAEDEMLRHYLSVTDTGQEQAGQRQFAAWKCAAPLWSSLWCTVGDMFSGGDVDFARRGQGKLDRLGPGHG